MNLVSTQLLVGNGERRVVLLLETHVSVRKIDRSVLATDIDAALGLAACVNRPDDQTVHPRAQRFNLIPVSSVGEAVGGVNEAVCDEKI